MKKILYTLISFLTLSSLTSCGSNQTPKTYNITFINESKQYGEIQKVEEGKLATKPSNPSKDEDKENYYTFSYWYDSLDSSKSPFDFETTVIHKDYTLEAYFTSTKKTYYKVSFDLNGGEGNIDSQEVEKGKYASKPGTIPNKEADHDYTYTFSYWFNADDETESEFNFASTQIMSNTVLKAKYNATKREYYNVSFNLNGGEGFIETQEVEKGKYASRPDYTPTKEADHDYYYTFSYWYDEKDSEKSPFDFDTIEIFNNIVLAAKYDSTERIYYSVDFDSNGGTGDIASQEIEKGKCASKPEIIPTLSPDHDHYYTFAYWYDQNDESELEFNFNSTPIVSNIVLKAKYNAAKREYYNVSFNLNGGEGFIETQEVEKGKYASRPDYTPTKEADHDHYYTFSYWYDSSDATQSEFDFNATPVNSNMILKAKYTPTDRIYYTVSFDVNGGKESIDSQKIEKDKHASVPQIVPTKEDDHINYYTFAYWYKKDDSSQTRFDFENTPIENDITLMAKYDVTSKVYFEISFNLNGGDGSIDSQEVEKGKCALKPSYIPTKKADHDNTYTFAYWYDEKDVSKSEFDFDNTKIYEDKVLVAKYSLIERVYYTVGFNLNGGKGDITSQEIEKGYSAIKPKVIPTKLSDTKDYEFVYWCLDLTNPVEFDFTTKINSNTTLYAYYASTNHKFNVVWKNKNGDILTKTQVISGQTPTYPLGYPYQAYNEAKDEGYLFDEWYNTTDNTRGISAITDHDVIYEATYFVSKVDDSMIFVDIPENSRDFYFNRYFEKEQVCSVDWGDGVTNNEKSHTYSKGGKYIIKISDCPTLNIAAYTQEANLSKIRRVKLGENITSISGGYWRLMNNVECFVTPKAAKGYEDTMKIDKKAFADSNINTMVYYHSSDIKQYGESQFVPSLKNLILDCDSNEDLPGNSIRESNIESLTIMGNLESIAPYSIYGCENLASVAILSRVKIIDNSAFEKCSSLEHINIPESVTEIHQYAFSETTSLKELYIPSSIESIGSYAFAYSLIKSFNLTGIKKVENFAFADLDKLEYIKFSSTLTSLSDTTFKRCYNLKVIDMTSFDEDNLPSIGLTKDLEDISYDCIILVKNQAVYNAFKNHVNWQYTAHRLVIAQ